MSDSDSNSVVLVYQSMETDGNTSSGTGGGMPQIGEKIFYGDMNEQQREAFRSVSDYAMELSPIYTYMSDIYNNSDLLRKSVFSYVLDNLEYVQVVEGSGDAITTASPLVQTEVPLDELTYELYDNGFVTTPPRESELDGVIETVDYPGDGSKYLIPNFTFVYRTVSTSDLGDRADIQDDLPDGFIKISKSRYNLQNAQGIQSTISAQGSTYQADFRADAQERYNRAVGQMTSEFKVFAPVEVAIPIDFSTNIEGTQFYVEGQAIQLADVLHNSIRPLGNSLTTQRSSEDINSALGKNMYSETYRNLFNNESISGPTSIYASTPLYGALMIEYSDTEASVLRSKFGGVGEQGTDGLVNAVVNGIAERNYQTLSTNLLQVPNIIKQKTLSPESLNSDFDNNSSENFVNIPATTAATSTGGGGSY